MEIFSDTKHRAVSLRQLSFLRNFQVNKVGQLLLITCVYLRYCLEHDCDFRIIISY